MLEGGAVAVSGDDDVTSNRAVRQMEDRIRELERQFGRKTLKVEILKEALDKSRSKASLVRHWSEDNGERRCLRSRSRKTVPDERRGRDPGRFPVEPACAADGTREAAAALP